MKEGTKECIRGATKQPECKTTSSMCQRPLKVQPTKKYKGTPLNREKENKAVTSMGEVLCNGFNLAVLYIPVTK